MKTRPGQIERRRSEKGNLTVAVVYAATAIILLVLPTHAAQLGFVGPTCSVRPADPFTVALVATFNRADIDGWRQGSLMDIGVNVAWPEGVTVLTCRWNTAAWSCSGIARDDWGLWASGRAWDFTAMTGAVTVAELDCAAAWNDGETFYYAVDSNAAPHSTFLTIADSTKTKDLLGDPNDAEDGVDECAVEVEDVPGYVLALSPAQRSVPLMLKAADVGVDIRQSAPAAPYGHVRAHVEFDSSVFRLVDARPLCASLPAFFTNVLVHCPADCVATASLPNVRIEADAYDGEVVVDAYCAPTNYVGRFATVPLMLQDIAVDSEIALDHDDYDWYTTIDRFGIDLLGAVDDDADGTEDTVVTVRHVDGLRVAVQPMEALETVGSAAQARVVLRKNIAGIALFDAVALKMQYDRGLLNCTTASFIPNTAAIGTGVSWSVTITTNPPAIVAPRGYPWTNTLLTLSLDWGLGACSIGTDELVLGTLRFTPRSAGVAGFLRADIEVTRFLASLDDETAGNTEWPALFSCVNSAQGVRSVRVALEREATQPLAVGYGDTISLRPHVEGSAVVDATYSLAWAYDSNLVELLTQSAFITSMVLRMTGETSAVLRVEGIVTSAGTADLAHIQFKARRPGTLAFRPVTPAMSAKEYCMFTQHGCDILGAPNIAGDGVSGYSIGIGEPEGVVLALSPAAPLYAGVAAEIQLSLLNPTTCRWNRIAAHLAFASGSFWSDATAWRLCGLDSASISTVVLQPSDKDALTTMATMARLAATTGERNDACVLASLPLMPLDDMAYDDISVVVSNTDVGYGDLSLADPAVPLAMDESQWRVYPSGAGIVLDDGGQSPVLGSNYTVTVRIANPHGVCVKRAACCWYFDASMFEVMATRLADGCATNGGGRVLVNNYGGSESYVAMDVRMAAPSTNASIALLALTLVPKANLVLEMVPGTVLLDDGEIPLAVWNQADVNVLELLDQWPEDACPLWRRGVVWRDMPQVVFDDIELGPYEVAALPLDTALRNFSAQKSYSWYVAGTPQHVSFSINPLTHIMTATSLDTWSGVERFTLCCREPGMPTIGFTSFQVTLNDGEPSLDISMRRTEFRWVTGQPFLDAGFTVLNPTGPVAVTAWIQYPDQTWHQAAVKNGVTGATGNMLDIRGDGQVVWQGAGVGSYLGRIDVRAAAAPTNEVDARAWFSVELIAPGVDSDGDTFYLVYKTWNTVRAYAGTSVNITDGADSDTIVLKVVKGPNGDGRVDLDTISSDHGIKKIELKGSVKTVRANGPIGLLKVTGGVVGEVIVSNGVVGAVVVKNVWDAGAGSFGDAGIAQGVYATMGIGVIAVYGGSIGADDAPASILTDAGSIKSVTTKLMKKRIPFLGSAYIATAGDDGAHIYADIRAPQGSIGAVTALGGTIGTLYGTEPCTIVAGNNIGKVRACGEVCGGVMYGGSMCADVCAGWTIADIEAVGGDIARSEVFDPEDIADPEHLPVRIRASVISAVKATACVMYDGITYMALGGSVHADIAASDSFGSFEAKGGDARLWLNAPSIKSVAVRAISFKEYKSDRKPLWRGGSILSSIIATTAADKFKSDDPVAYMGTIGALAADVGVSDSWIGLRGPNRGDQFAYTKFACGQCTGTEIWEANGAYLHIVKF